MIHRDVENCKLHGVSPGVIVRSSRLGGRLTLVVKKGKSVLPLPVVLKFCEGILIAARGVWVLAFEATTYAVSAFHSPEDDE